MSRIELRGINKYYGGNHVLKDINLVIEDGEFMTLLGPSGCGRQPPPARGGRPGKAPEKGTWGDREIVNAPEKFYEEPGRKRHLNLVFQSYALWAPCDGI